jgi:uncharacterized protein involved in type VI secretion and phage assembly
MNLANPYHGQEQERNFGVAIAIVTNNRDPDNLGRVKLKFPWRDDSNESNWARIAVLMAGSDKRTYFLPDVGDEVLVSFDNGDFAKPYVIGALWNGKDKPPEKNCDGENNTRIIKSKSGHKIVFADEPGRGRVEVQTSSGHHMVLDDSAGCERIEIKDKSGNSILIDSAQNSISFSSQTKISIHAPIVEICAGATLTLRGGIVKIN